MGSTTQWRGQSDTTLGRLGWGVLLSLLLHAPFVPFVVGLLGLMALLTTSQPPPETLPPLTGIPVDLLEGDEAEAPPEAVQPPPAPEPVAALAPAPNEPERTVPKARDAGVADAQPHDADASDASDAAVEGTDAGVADGGIVDPVAASGAERVADVNANVQIIIHSEKLRAHPLAPRIGRSLASVYQWRDFFGPAGLDPIADVDRILVAAPQLRDSSEAAAVVVFNASPERVRAVVEAIVRSDPETGAWVDAGVPVATARVDRAQRYFILGSPKVVVMTPPSAYENARKSAKRVTVRASAGPEVVVARLATPWRAFRGSGIPFDVPKSIAWARARVTPGTGGGAIVEIVAKDENPELAAENAEYLARNVRAMTQLNLGILGAILGTGNQKFVESVSFVAREDQIHGTLVVTARQLETLLDLATTFLAPRPARSRPARATPDSGGASNPLEAPATPSATPLAP